MAIKNLQDYSLRFIDFVQLFTNCMFETPLDENNELHKHIITFSRSDLHIMDIDLDNTIMTPTFIDFSWEGNEYYVDITYDVDEGFTEFEVIPKDD